MARKRTGMKKIREVIRLKSTTKMSDRQIGISPPSPIQIAETRLS